MIQLRALLVVLVLGLAAAPVHAVPYTPWTTPSFPHAKVTPLRGTTLLCSTWADPMVCDLKPGGTYLLHQWTADWSRTVREEILIPNPSTADTIRELQSRVRYLERQLAACRAR